MRALLRAFWEVEASSLHGILFGGALANLAVALGVHDAMHVLHSADDGELAHRLVGRDHQLRPGRLVLTSR